MSVLQDSPTTIDEPEAAIAIPLEFEHYLISAGVFRRMLEAEVFADDDRVELWDGRLYRKMAKTQAHAVAGNLASLVLGRLLPEGWFLGSENPVTINQGRVPIPDLIILRGLPKDYIHRSPTPGDVGLIVEFSLTSLRFDVGAKLAGYASANIPIYWVLNLVENLILVFERPVPSERRYESSQVIAVGQSVALRLDGVLLAEIPALDLLPIRG